MHGNSDSGAGGLVGALVSIAIGTVIFVFSLGTLIAVLFFGTSIATIGGARWVLGTPSDATATKIALAGGAYTGLVLLSFGLTYVVTNDPGLAGLIMGSNGFVGVVAVLIGAAVAWARTLGNGGYH